MNKQFLRQTEERMFYLDHEDIMVLEKTDQGQINNVIQGLENQVYGVWLDHDNKTNVDFTLFFINGKPELEGYGIKLNSSDKEWMGHLQSFTAFLTTQFNNLDPIDTYNTLILSARTMFEKLGFFTITSQEMDPINHLNPSIMLSNKRGVIFLTFADKIEVLRNLFKSSLERKEKILNREEDKVYLMYNNANNLTKIGRSKNPKTREKTLQGEDPKLDIIAYWIAPKEIEKELHKKFSKKRTRGEWFNLTVKDYIDIKKEMSKFERR